MMPTVPVWTGGIVLLSLAGSLSNRSRAQDLIDANTKEVVSHDFGRTWIDSGAARQSGSGRSENSRQSPAQLEQQQGYQQRQEGVRQLELGNTDAAIVLLWNALSRLPDDPAVKRSLGIAQNAKGLEYGKNGKWAEAMDQFAYALEQCPGDPEFRQNRRNAAAMFKQSQAAFQKESASRQIAADLKSLAQEIRSSATGAGTLQFSSSGPALMSAHLHSETAEALADSAETQVSGDDLGLPNYEPASAEARKAWDTRGGWAGTITAVALHGMTLPPRMAFEVRQWKEDAVIQQELKNQEAASAEHARLQAELANVRKAKREKAAGNDDTGGLDVREADLKQQISLAESRADTSGVKIRDRVRMLHFHVVPLQTSATAAPEQATP